MKIKVIPLAPPPASSVHTSARASHVPPAQAPPNQALPTQAPPTQAPPTQAPLTQLQHPLAPLPPTQAPPSNGTIRNSPPTAGSSTYGPPTAGSSAWNPPSEGHPTVTPRPAHDPPTGGHDTPLEGTAESDKSGSGGNAPTNNPPAASESSICRICQEGRSKEELISPCHCSGTIGHMHLSCLEHWLQLMHRSSCELCKYEFPVERVAQPLHRFFLNPGSNTEFANLVCDISCFLILTPLLVITMFLCTRGVKYYDEHGKVWSMLAVITLLGSLLVVYMSWAVLAFLYHYRIWRTWRRNTMAIRMCVDRHNRIYVNKPQEPRRPLEQAAAVGRMERGVNSAHGAGPALLNSRHRLLIGRDRWDVHRPMYQCPMSTNCPIDHQEIAEYRAERARNIMEAFCPGYFGMNLTGSSDCGSGQKHQRTRCCLETHAMGKVGAQHQKKLKLKKTKVSNVKRAPMDRPHHVDFSSSSSSFVSPYQTSSTSSEISSDVPERADTGCRWAPLACAEDDEDEIDNARATVPDEGDVVQVMSQHKADTTCASDAVVGAIAPAGGEELRDPTQEKGPGIGDATWTRGAEGGDTTQPSGGEVGDAAQAICKDVEDTSEAVQQVENTKGTK